MTLIDKPVPDLRPPLHKEEEICVDAEDLLELQPVSKIET